MDERRQLPRWEIKKDIKVWIPMTQGFGHCVLEDMHLKGMCVSFDKPMPVEKLSRISFELKNEFIKIEATVPWKRENSGRYFYGLSFTQIADLDKEKIYQFINTSCYDQFKDKWWSQ